MAPPHQFLKGFPGSLRHGLDAAVEAISDPPHEAKTTRLGLDAGAEEDALDGPVDEDPYGGRHWWVGGRQQVGPR
eukprot:CAMPEP_0184729616 /NCGR_PEP_ID=MMETSP0314-20130426/44751_1 /TAXON_ID=38298 /ORGANISM="Rhodella maculata, Strain CCMP 736" /LENGTH=74 /DNA_ID=CAMNT_0027195663 /DNA_START=204 /DNA_END=424 /DNA_ORIENTATION=-